MLAVGPKPPRHPDTLVLTRSDVRRVLDLPTCIEAVERAFLRHATGQTVPPGVLATHVDGGGFHVKTAGMLAASGEERPVFAAKVNANFPGNPDRFGLPTIQGVIALFDGRDGRVLAVLDSIEITSVRTAAATAVAAKYLALEDAATVTICGCGEQSRSQLRALACVRPIRRVMALDLDADRAARFADEMAEELAIDVSVVRELGERTRESDIWVTCTTARRWFLGREHTGAGAFIGAVGADNPEKQEIAPALLAASTVVVDVLDQCATIGELHHALEIGVMRMTDVHAELAEIVAGRKPGRASPNEIIVFDSTGTALQDVAAATLVYERALATGVGTPVDLGGAPDVGDAVAAVSR
jgi:ornithine cyclodeaminase/alanine dehydrogenase-like protein (mu-crystallin family)